MAHTTRFTRHARTKRMLARLGEGRSYAEVAREEGLSERRVRQIVAERLKRREAADEGTHANVQIDRLSFALKVAGEALAEGDLRAVAPFIKAVDRLDHYQARAREAAPRRISSEADKLVMRELVRRIREGVEQERAAAAPPAPEGAAPPAAEFSAALAEPAIETEAIAPQGIETEANAAPPPADTPAAAPPPAPLPQTNFALSNFSPFIW